MEIYEAEITNTCKTFSVFIPELKQFSKSMFALAMQDLPKSYKMTKISLRGVPATGVVCKNLHGRIHCVVVVVGSPNLRSRKVLRHLHPP